MLKHMSFTSFCGSGTSVSLCGISKVDHILIDVVVDGLNTYLLFIMLAFSHSNKMCHLSSRQLTDPVAAIQCLLQ